MEILLSICFVLLTKIFFFAKCIYRISNIKNVHGVSILIFCSISCSGNHHPVKVTVKQKPVMDVKVKVYFISLL